MHSVAVGGAGFVFIDLVMGNPNVLGLSMLLIITYNNYRFNLFVVGFL